MSDTLKPVKPVKPVKPRAKTRTGTNAATLVRAISAKGIERSALSGLSAMSLRSPMSPLSPMSPRSPVSLVSLANAASPANLGSQKAKSKCNNDITTRKKHSSFIFFGCWNNVNCEKEFIYRDIVLDYIHQNEAAVKQLYIAGDNWYTNATKINAKNFKVYLTDVLTRGYDKLYSMKKEIYIAVGNHDEDKDATMTNPRLQKDCNVNTQKYYLKQIKERRDGRDDGRDRRPPRGAIREPTLDELNFLASKGRLTDNYLCKKGVYIYVDDIGVRYNEGNIVIIINTNKFDDYEEGLAYLENIRLFINDVVGSSGSTGTGEQIFVMGHIPLFNFKKDKIKIQDINKKEPIFRNIIVGLFDMLVENRIIYICADTHNFSIMRIKCNGDDARVLIQITAGSGGADPDLLSTEYKTSPTTTKVKDAINEYKFEIEAYALNSYGYATITTGSGSDSSGSVSICYKQIIKDIDDTTKKASAAASGTSGSDTKITEITYKVNTMDKTIVVEKHENPRAAINTYKNKEICDKIKKQKRGYITSLDHKTACYMKKDKKAKE
jgi:hypothetical protein